MDEARSVRDFWFGTAPPTAEALTRRVPFWFGEGASALRARRDAHIRARFGALLERAARGELDAWADGPRRRLSLIILLDQFPRSIFRGTPRAFAHDGQALALTLSGMQSAADAALTVVERIFFYMPLQHAERAEVQEESVAAYRRLLAEAPEPLRGHFAGALRSAENHHAIIERFGRFPHRNRALGRECTPPELDWLGAGGASFGQ
ncbi:MAG: DUF924 domain-containing protein [Gammaproteobacteria bacterium]|nr:DUF924 domain-containing protein [Gammaproteobacteria bacterium]MBV8975216.1 DUF924 domain-containing protein [Nevskiaceae bacterium]MBV9318258.1 DUF924 domain-containing protein [Gammaproteobacteria bacterium]MBV9727320.1 DUF924 domain-containing protein [Gammaproteobacteria bacterium]